MEPPKWRFHLVCRQKRLVYYLLDVLFYFTYANSNAVEEEWTNDPLFKNLTAVKEGNNAHKVSDIFWNTTGGVIAANIMLDEIEKTFTGK
jgi:iron complex transport system substrate-binding protein